MPFSRWETEKKRRLPPGKRMEVARKTRLFSTKCFSCHCLDVLWTFQQTIARTLMFVIINLETLGRSKVWQMPIGCGWTSEDCDSKNQSKRLFLLCTFMCLNITFSYTSNDNICIVESHPHWIHRRDLCHFFLTCKKGVDGRQVGRLARTGWKHNIRQSKTQTLDG
jgi:hypothetical protein